MSRQIYAINKEEKNALPLFFDSLTEAAVFFRLTTGTILYHVKRGTPIKGYKLVDGSGFAGKDVTDQGIEGEGTLIHYETSSILVCITPCPYAEEPKPMVGSAPCMRCKHFLGKDIKEKIVRCNFKQGWTNRNK